MRVKHYDLTFILFRQSVAIKLLFVALRNAHLE